MNGLTIGIGATIYILSLLLVYILVKKKYRNDFDLDEINSLLSEILKINFKNNSLSSAAQNIILVLKRFYSTDYITILLFNEKTGNMRIIASNVDSHFLSSIEEYCNESFGTLGKRASKVASSQGGALSYDTAEERGIHFSNFTPLKHNNKVIGGILLENKETGTLDDINTRMELYYKVFQSTALVLQNVLYTENLISMTSTDQLTGVYNRRFIDMTLAEQLNIHRNLDMSMSVSIFDIDKFKVFNDTYGHPFGDIVLQDVAKFMQDNMSGENEWVARYGGEEFVLFFGRSNPNEVAHKVNELRKGLSNLKLTDGTTVTNVTASFGIASYPHFDESASGLIAKADEALYKSKENGRNRVTIAK